MKKIAIVGFGGAGYNAARAARKYDPDAVIDVYTETDTGPYNPMLTTYFVKGAIDCPALFPFGSLEDIRTNLHINIFPETSVVAMDAGQKRLTLSNNVTQQYDSILISTGASAFMPPIAGIDLLGVFKMRTARDAAALKQELDKGRAKIGLVIGASWVGIKVIEDFDARGMKCILVDGANWIFPTATFEETAQRIHKDLRQKGVELAFGQMLARIERESDGRLSAVMQSGSRFTADIIAVCIGIRANIRFAIDAGIQAGRALIVDEHMRTSAPGIYAAGDCCEAVDIQTRTPKNIGVWMNAQRQGAVAGANMVGVPEKFGANLLLNLAHYMDYDFVSIGDITTCTPEDEAYEYEDDHYYILAKKRRGRITCINMIGTADSNGVVKQILTRAFETGSTGLDIKTACFLIDKGFPKGFIDFIGGITID